MASNLATPQSLRTLGIINEIYAPDQKLAFTKSLAAIDHRIRLIENLNLLTDGNKFLVSNYLKYYLKTQMYRRIGSLPGR